MALKRHIFDVYVAPLDDDGKADFAAEPLEFLAVEVRQGDIIRAELEGNKRRLPTGDKAAMLATTLWVWAVLQRTGDLSCKWPEFRARCIAVQAVKGADGKAVESDVDPTRLGRSEQPSSSRPTSAGDPPTGSTPASTTD